MMKKKSRKTLAGSSLLGRLTNAGTPLLVTAYAGAPIPGRDPNLGTELFGRK